MEHGYRCTMLTVVLCVLLSICVVAAICARARVKAHALPPAFRGGLPIIGHTHLLLTDTANLWHLLQESAVDATSKGGVTHVVLGREVYYMIADAEDALTASNACMQKHFAFDFAKPFVGNGMLTASGETWKRHRRLLQPAFSLPILHGFLTIFNSQAKKLVGKLEPHVAKGSFNHEGYLRKIALETFCLGTFGVCAIEDNDFVQNYMDAVDTLLRIVTTRFQTFWLHNDLMFKLSGLKKKERMAVDTLYRMSNEILQRKKAQMKYGAVDNNVNDTTIHNATTTGIKYKPALELLLELSAQGALTDNEIREEMSTMIAAGFETTSNQLMYTLMLLGSHPAEQNKMVQELLEVLGPHRDVDKDDINKLVYTNAVLMESLRVYPSVPVLLRYVENDVKLKNYTMRAGSQCVLYPLVNPKDPIWDPEGDKFKPERWLDNADLKAKKEFAGFGLGKRACIGRQYAMISMKVFLAHFLRNYKVKADMNKLKVKIDFVLKPIIGQEISIERRN